LIGFKVGLVSTCTRFLRGTFGDCLLLCIFVLIIFIRSCFICAIVGLFVLLKKGKKVGMNQFFLVWCWYKVFAVWAKNVKLQEVFI